MKKQETKNKDKKKLVKTVDATPSWVSLVPLFIEWIQDGNSQQHMDASENIRQMAKIADAYRANIKKIEMHDELMDIVKKIYGGLDQLDRIEKFLKNPNKNK